MSRAMSIPSTTRPRKTFLCCDNRQCCDDPTCDIALNRLPEGSFSDEYIECLYTVRHLMKEVSTKGWFFAFWIDSIFYDSSEYATPLALNDRFKDAVKY